MAAPDPTKRPRPGPWPPLPEETTTAMPPTSWAKRTGFRPKFSGETNATNSGQLQQPQPPPPPLQSKPPPTIRQEEAGRPNPVDLELGRRPKVSGQPADEKVKRRDSNGKNNVNGQAAETTTTSRRAVRKEEEEEVLAVEENEGFGGRQTHMNYELRDTPGLGENLIINVYSFLFYLP